MKKIFFAAVLLLLATAAHAQWPDRGKLNVWTFATVSRAGDQEHEIYLRKVRTAKQKTFDRITLEFTGGIPRYEISTEKSGSFETTAESFRTVHGKAYMSITMHGLPYPESPADDAVIPKGDLKLPTLREIKEIEWFEGDRFFGIGLSRRRMFRVLELKHPDRLVIDVKH